MCARACSRHSQLCTCGCTNPAYRRLAPNTALGLPHHARSLRAGTIAGRPAPRSSTSSPGRLASSSSRAAPYSCLSTNQAPSPSRDTCRPSSRVRSRSGDDPLFAPVRSAFRRICRHVLAVLRQFVLLGHYTREVRYMRDGGCVALDWWAGRHAAQRQQDSRTPILLVLHGLSGV